MNAEPVLIMVAPNGARRTKVHHPDLPITIEETVTAARAAYEQGAAALHLHVREKDGRHSLDTARYLEALAEMGEAVPGMVVQITTESAGIYEPQAQLACLEGVVPAAASVSVREIARDPAVAERLYRFALEAGISIQHILYDEADLATLEHWWATGTVSREQRCVIAVLGAYAEESHGDPAEPFGWAGRAAELDLAWTVCAFGPREHACLATAMALGAHCRVGFENNLWLPDGTLAPNSAALVALSARQAELFGRPLIDGATARRLIGKII